MTLPPVLLYNKSDNYNKLDLKIKIKLLKQLDFRKENILKDVSFVQYLREKNNIFSEIYKTHYIDNAKQFVLMNNLESMCQCWLMYLYH